MMAGDLSFILSKNDLILGDHTSPRIKEPAATSQNVVFFGASGESFAGSRSLRAIECGLLS